MRMYTCLLSNLLYPRKLQQRVIAATSQRLLSRGRGTHGVHLFAEQNNKERYSLWFARSPLVLYIYLEE